MELEPCPQCRRHVAIDATACPFCAAPLAAQPARLVAAGRWSRAAIFAGAALAACHPAPQSTPPPNGSGDERQYAQPPGDAAPPVTGAGTIFGVVRDEKGRGIANIRVRLQPTEQTATTNGKGEYSFANLPPGNYEIVFHEAHNPRQGPNMGYAKVEADKIVEVDGVIYPEPVDNGPCCKPYGAPPARRRIV